MNLNIIPNGAIKRVHVSQNDAGRTLTFELFNNSTTYTIPSGAVVKIQGTKPSGFGFSETCTVSGNTVTVDTTETMTDEYGYIETELVIESSGDVLGTSNFILAVERNPHPSNTTDGTQITAQSLQVQINELAEIIESGGSGLTDGAKQALLNCFAHVAWIDEHGQDYYDALEDALYPPATLTSISAVYTQSGTVYTNDSLDDLKADLVVTAHYDNGTTQTITTYTLSGTLTVGTSTITVAYGGKTTTFDVTVSAEDEWGTDYTWLYKASDGALLSARTDLVTPTIGANCTETLVDGLLHLFVPKSTSNTIKYALTQTTNTNAILKAKVRFASIGYAPNVTDGTGFRLQLSNGTNGTQILERRDSTNHYFVTYQQGASTDQITFDLNTWYIISVERRSGQQVVTVNGVDILTSSTMSTYYCTANTILAQNTPATSGDIDDLNVDIEWITYKNND